MIFIKPSSVWWGNNLLILLSSVFFLTLSLAVALSTWSEFSLMFNLMPHLVWGFNFFFFQKIFFLFVTSITFSIVTFSFYYMAKSEILVFSIMLWFFLIFMLILTLSKNLFFMFLGWEGVGLMSFLLIGWFSSREAAIFSSKKAVFYNRVGDFFFLLLISCEMMNQLHFFHLINNFISLSSNFSESLQFIFLMSCCFSVIVKSAQFFFSPWLTSAMEGPTPVSALLHSSTMVVAGVYFFIISSPFLQTLQSSFFWFLSLIGIMGMLMTSMAALMHSDMKKVVALSTASQLSFMIFIISIGNLDLAFFHLIVHGFFKALLFLSSGLIIHTSDNMQDFRKFQRSSVGNFKLFIVHHFSSMGLIGQPFFGAFVSKHLILSWVSSMDSSIIILFMFYLALFFTLAYSHLLSKMILKQSFESPILMAGKSPLDDPVPGMSITWLFLFMFFFAWSLQYFFHDHISSQLHFSHFFFFIVFWGGSTILILSHVKIYPKMASMFFLKYAHFSKFNRFIFSKNSSLALIFSSHLDLNSFSIFYKNKTLEFVMNNLPVKMSFSWTLSNLKLMLSFILLVGIMI